jgi:hypothetical protein
MSTPRQRLTRANSTPDVHPSLSQIKSLLDNQKSEILAHLKEDTSLIKSLLEVLTDRLASLESKLVAATLRIDELESQAKTHLLDAEPLMEEMQRRYSIRKNVVNFLDYKNLPTVTLCKENKQTLHQLRVF